MKKKPTIVILILLTFFVVSFMTNILGALNPSISKSFNLTETMAGFLPFSFFIAYGVMSIPSCFLLEKYGAKKMMIFAFTLSFIASIIFSTFPSFETFLLSLFAIGSGMAALQVVINPLLRVSGGEEHFAFNSVLAQLIFGSASFISPQVYSWIVTNVNGNRRISSPFTTLLSSIVPEDMTWISMYWIFAITSLIMMLIIFVFVFPKVELKEDEKVGTLENYKSLLKKRTTLLFFFGIFAYVGAEQGISYWMSKYLQVYHGFNFETTGAHAVANFWGYLTAGGIIGLFLLKFMDSKIILRIFTILAITSLAFALFSESNISFYSFQFCGFFLSVMYPIIVSLALNSVKDNHGAFTGILMSGIMGGAIIQLMIGFISDITSLKVGMTLVFLALGYVLSISFWAKPLIKNKVIKLKRY
jgi:fucose permease